MVNIVLVAKIVIIIFRNSRITIRPCDRRFFVIIRNIIKVMVRIIRITTQLLGLLNQWELLIWDLS